ncbi:hypothetical protein WA158_004422 [Blastocystis sp. Blastoise]
MMTCESMQTIWNVNNVTYSYNTKTLPSRQITNDEFVNYYESERYSHGYKTLDNRDKKGQGVIMFAYSTDSSSARKYFKEAYGSALKMTQIDDQIQICIFTSDSANITSTKRIMIKIIPPFHVFPGKPNTKYHTSSRQFRTRVLYLGLTPFKTTLALDSSSSFCIPNAGTRILDFFKTTNVDFSCTSRTVDERFCSGHALIYNWNSRTQHFLRNLFYATLDDSDLGDDQRALRVILPVAIKSGTLHFRWFSNSKLFSGNNYGPNGKSDQGRAYRLSAPLKGPVYIVHETSLLCPYLNQENEIDQTRMYCFKHTLERKDLIKLINHNKTAFGTRYFAHNIHELEDCVAPYPIPKISYPINKIQSTSFFIDF